MRAVWKCPAFLDADSLKMPSLSGRGQFENAQPLLALQPCTAFDWSVTVASLLLLHLSPPPFFSLRIAHLFRHCALYLHVHLASFFSFFFFFFKGSGASEVVGVCPCVEFCTQVAGVFDTVRGEWAPEINTLSPPVAVWLALSPVFLLLVLRTKYCFTLQHSRLQCLSHC